MKFITILAITIGICVVYTAGDDGPGNACNCHCYPNPDNPKATICKCEKCPDSDEHTDPTPTPAPTPAPAPCDCSCPLRRPRSPTASEPRCNCPRCPFELRQLPKFYADDD